MKRITFYTSDHYYMGWVLADWQISGSELGSWLRYSPTVDKPNYVKYLGKIYNDLIELKTELGAY